MRYTLGDAQASYRTRIRFYAGTYIRVRTCVELSGSGHIRDEEPDDVERGIPRVELSGFRNKVININADIC